MYWPLLVASMYTEWPWRSFQASRPLRARSCNASKCNDEVTGWLRRKRLDEATFLTRHYEIRAGLTERFAPEPTARP